MEFDNEELINELFRLYIKDVFNIEKSLPENLYNLGKSRAFIEVVNRFKSYENFVFHGEEFKVLKEIENQFLAKIKWLDDNPDYYIDNYPVYDERKNYLNGLISGYEYGVWCVAQMQKDLFNQ